MKKRVIAISLALALTLTLCPASALAVPEGDDSTAAPEEEDILTAPEENDGTVVPEEDVSPAVPEEEDIPAIPEGDDSTVASEEDDNTAAPEEDAGVYDTPADAIDSVMPVHGLGGRDDESDFEYPTELRPSNGPIRVSPKSSLPSRYVDEAYANQTGVKDQGENGLCWAFCTYGALESWIKVHHKMVCDFSELHMGYATSTSGGNPFYGFDSREWPEDGGSRSTAASYLMRGSRLNGAVMEADDPYEDYYYMPDRDAADSDAIQPSYTVQNILFLTGGDGETNYNKTQTAVETIKRHIMSQGGVGSCMWSEMGTVSSNTKKSLYYNGENTAYFYNGSRKDSSNHLVEIVGWDDDYPKKNFAEGNQPENNGAWLVKNSWGTRWGSNNGYFWVSYEDHDFPRFTYCFDGDVTPCDPSAHVYETDYASDGYSWGYNVTSSLQEAYFVRVYETLTDNESLSAVRFQIAAPSKVQVGLVDLNGLRQPKTGSNVFHPLNVTTTANSNDVQCDGTTTAFKYPGWYTLSISSPPEYPKAGIPFAIALKLTPYSSATARLAVGYDAQNLLPADQTSAYLTTDTTKWSKPGTEGANFCIKAVTTLTTPVSVKSWSAGETSTTVTFSDPRNLLKSGSTVYAAQYNADGRMTQAGMGIRSGTAVEIRGQLSQNWVLFLLDPRYLTVSPKIKLRDAMNANPLR